MSKIPTNQLERWESDLHEHWEAILDIQRMLYDKKVELRRGARECEKLLREIERITQPAIRVAPTRLEAVRSFDEARGTDD